MITAPFDYHSPKSVTEAVALLEQYGSNAKILAGGQSLIPLMKLRLAEPEILVDLADIPSMSYIQEKNSGLAIGGMTTYREIESSGILPKALSEAAGLVADPQVRNRGTIGGSLAHSDPAADLPAPVIALDGQIIATSKDGDRTIPSEDFFTDLFSTALTDEELITEVFIPKPSSETGTAYCKFGNKASHYAVAGVAASLTVDKSGTCIGARIGVTGTGPSAYRAIKSETILVGTKLDQDSIQEAGANILENTSVNEDVHASSEYRAHLTKVYAVKALVLASSRAK